MSPAALIPRDCDDSHNNCGVRPSTYATPVALVLLFLLFLFCFCCVRRRRAARIVQANRPIFAPFTPNQYPPRARPPPPAFEPAPPYEPKPAEPIQYPPPSYAPGNQF